MMITALRPEPKIITLVQAGEKASGKLQVLTDSMTTRDGTRVVVRIAGDTIMTTRFRPSARTAYADTVVVVIRGDSGWQLKPGPVVALDAASVARWRTVVRNSLEAKRFDSLFKARRP
jgi:hypothetical protein